MIWIRNFLERHGATSVVYDTAEYPMEDIEFLIHHIVVLIVSETALKPCACSLSERTEKSLLNLIYMGRSKY